MQVEMTIENFYDFYKNQLLGKTYCSYEEVEASYHYERVEKGYDHLGSLGYETVKVIDSYKTVVVKERVKKSNAIDIARKLVKGKGWLEDCSPNTAPTAV